MTVLFNRAKIASAVAAILYIMGYLPYLYVMMVESTGPLQPSWMKCLSVSTVH